MDFIFADCLVVLDMFSDQYCWCRGFTDLKYKFLSLAPGFVFLNVIHVLQSFFFFFFFFFFFSEVIFWSL
jgi:hypothetical protein